MIRPCLFQRVVESYGVTDVIDVRFAENRQNGQSRGFATVIVGSETSGKTLMDRLPGRQLHGNLLSALPFNKTSLQRLEEATRSSAPQVCPILFVDCVRLGEEGRQV